MYLKKPKIRDISGKVIPEDDFNWEVMRGNYTVPEVKPRKVTQSKNAAGQEMTTFSGFPVDTIWGSLQGFFATNKLGSSYLHTVEKSGRKVHKDTGGLVLHENGTTNLCTTSPWREFRVRKIEAVKPSFPDKHHQYDITIYFEKPVEVLLGEFWRKVRRYGRKFSYAWYYAVQGWKNGWYKA